MPSAHHLQGEVLLAPRLSPNGGVAPVTHVRSTLIASSLVSLRAHGHIERYFGELPEALHPAMQAMVAGSWLPLELGLAHYRACEGLGLSSTEQYAIGFEVSERIQNSVLGTLVRLAKAGGATPWTAVGHFQRLWDRLLKGGSAAVYRLGPKEACAEILACPLAEIPYVRTGWRGMFAGSLSLFAQKVYVTEMTAPTRDASAAFKIAWA